MADDEAQKDCAVCDIAFQALVWLGVCAVGFIAWDTFTGGAATEWLTGLFRKGGTVLASVTPIGGESDESAG